MEVLKCNVLSPVSLCLNWYEPLSFYLVSLNIILIWEIITKLDYKGSNSSNFVLIGL